LCTWVDYDLNVFGNWQTVGKCHNVTPRILIVVTRVMFWMGGGRCIVDFCLLLTKIISAYLAGQRGFKFLYLETACIFYSSHVFCLTGSLTHIYRWTARCRGNICRSRRYYGFDLIVIIIITIVINPSCAWLNLCAGVVVKSMYNNSAWMIYRKPLYLI